MSAELEAAWYRESMRLLGVEIHRWAQAPEMEQASTCKKPLFVELRDGLLVPNTSCPVEEVSKLYEFCGQLIKKDSTNCLVLVRGGRQRAVRSRVKFSLFFACQVC
jgi:hypothetical protein